MEIHTDNYHGRVTKSALVETNDPNKTRLTIYLEATVTAIFSASPEANLIINTKVGQPASVKVQLVNQLPDPVEITGANNPFGDKAEIKLETIEAGRKYAVTMSTKALEKFRWTGRVNLNLKGAPAPVYSMPAYLAITE